MFTVNHNKRSGRLCNSVSLSKRTTEIFWVDGIGKRKYRKDMENIVINVDFQSRDLSSIFANEVQVVPGDIAWEDLELMVFNRNDV